MNEETQNLINSKITELLSWLEEAGKTGSSFVVEQTPLYIQELLAWNFWYSLLWFGFGAVFCLIACHGTKVGLKNTNWDGDDDFPKQIYSILSTTIGVILGPVFVFSNLEWLQIKLAPRVWLVEYLQGMIQ